MNDKPVVQFKLSVPDTDSLRDMIRRDHATALLEIARLSSFLPADRNEAWHGANSSIQRDLHKTEHLAEIFSVTLAKS